MLPERSFLAALVVCLCGQLGAEPFPLRPARADYGISISGVPTGVDASIELTRLEADRYELVFSVNHALLKHQESSRFQWSPACRAHPLGYAYQSRGFGIRRGGKVDFDWSGLIATGDDDSYPIDDSVVDAMGVAMMARCELKAGLEQLQFNVAEPDGLNRFQYRVLKHEMLKTPAGTFRTIKVERVYPERGQRTVLWAAIDLDYFMVRMDHIENPLLRGKMELTSFEWLPAAAAAASALPKKH